ncbi:mediator complex subunit Med31 [Dipodascopsis tothii]|uniref:mediator complex subunit Med31 n=1 Tax=Dipodascopsis tothii TaxID=44089 RepID=UPI0034CF5564
MATHEEQAGEAAPPPPSRFEVELEFVQSLANPQYVNFLAQNKYLDDERFLRYLEYLEYWRRPEYVRFVAYPNCLHMLTLLKQAFFRQEIMHADMADRLMADIYDKWLGQGRYKAPPEPPLPGEVVEPKPEPVATE